MNKYVTAGAVLVSTMLAASWTGAEPAEPSQSDAAAKLARLCTPEAMQEVASGLGAGVTIAKVANGPQLAGGTRFVAAKGKTPAFCQVTGSYVTNPKTGKTANFIGTFPEEWNGKYLQLGCSGSCGVLIMNDAALPAIAITAQGWPGQLIQKGYAAFGNDLGHIDKGPNLGWGWAYGDDGALSEDNLADYLYRADEVLADTGKRFATAFYERMVNAPRPIDRSYYMGCSQGGRGALIAASRFPEKFDGIIAGSPASDLQALIFHPAAIAALDQASGAAKLSPAQTSLLQANVTAQCDLLDGVADGLIQNPAACNFAPEKDLPLCQPGSAGDDCFTAAQLQTIGSFVSASRDGSGKLIAPGYSISNLSLSFDLRGPDGTLPDAVIRRFIGAPDGAKMLVGFRKGKSGGIGLTGDSEAYRRLTEILGKGTVQPEDLSRLVDRGGKLLWYHNLSDEALTPYLSINRYKALAILHGGYARLQDNIRLFALPGTGHCGMSGVGPTNFDAIGALEAWVERGIAPNALIARKLDPKKENVLYGTIDWNLKSPRTMPLCMFPQMAHYKGTGDVNDAANWECHETDQRMLKVGKSGSVAGVAK